MDPLDLNPYPPVKMEIKEEALGNSEQSLDCGLNFDSETSLAELRHLADSQHQVFVSGIPNDEDQDSVIFARSPMCQISSNVDGTILNNSVTLVITPVFKDPLEGGPTKRKFPTILPKPVLTMPQMSQLPQVLPMPQISQQPQVLPMPQISQQPQVLPMPQISQKQKVVKKNQAASRMKREKPQRSKPEKEDDKFPCTLCEHVNYDTFVEAKAHLWTHHRQRVKFYLMPKLYQCNVPSCFPLIFDTFLELAKHIKRIHKARRSDSLRRSHVCNLCAKTFSTEDSLKGHQSSCKETRLSKGFQCSYCLKILPDLNRLNNHYIGCNRELKSRILCRFCPPKIKSRYTWCSTDLIDLHIKKEHGMEVLFCLECLKYFGCDRSLRKHRQDTGHDVRKDSDEMSPVSSFIKIEPELPSIYLSMPNEVLYRCDICKDVAKSREALELHQQFDHPMVKIRCTECTLIFSSNIKLSKHLEAIHERKIQSTY